ncbi:T-complex 1 subunit gamma [Gossypium australe]|uniref:T-complex 1 subunit gamma n=1 Tax=Gossypium australe TaxID=47621 RepID=A0A5B6WE32_9ROSI|nr:T-complex 1 subunit gamma [Gossypium australe]
MKSFSTPRTTLKNVATIFLYLSTSGALSIVNHPLAPEIHQRRENIPRYSPYCNLNFFWDIQFP